MPGIAVATMPYKLVRKVPMQIIVDINTMSKAVSRVLKKIVYIMMTSRKPVAYAGSTRLSDAGCSSWAVGVVSQSELSAADIPRVQKLKKRKGSEKEAKKETNFESHLDCTVNGPENYENVISSGSLPQLGTSSLTEV